MQSFETRSWDSVNCEFIDGNDLGLLVSNPRFRDTGCASPAKAAYKAKRDTDRHPIVDKLHTVAETLTSD